MEIRRVTPEDWSELRSLRLAALSESPDAFARTRTEEERLTEAEWRERARRPMFIVRHEDRSVGMAGAYPEEPGVVVLYGMWVHPDHRRAGVGRALVAAVLDWARSEGAERLRLGVTESNDVALRFYLANGFVATGPRGPLRADSTLMELEMERLIS